MKSYDVIIIGSGQAASPLATKLSEKKKKVALIEKRKIGGTCINDGCTPTKSMIASAKTAYTARRGSEFGVHTGDIKVDLQEVVARKDKIVDAFRQPSKKSLEEDENIDVIYGRGSFLGPKKVKVEFDDGNTTELTAELIFIDTGSRPSLPSIERLSEVPYFTSTTLLDLTDLPDHLLVIGGGAIALELGQMYRRFGSRVTIVEKNDRLLSFEDKDISEEMLNILREDDIDVWLGCSVSGVNNFHQIIEALVERNGETKNIDCSHLLIASGRAPNTDELNLEAAGVETDEKGYVKVNEKLQTSADGIYALGDVKGGPKFTHISYNDYAVVFENLFENGHATIKNRMVPYCIYTDPQLGRIGESEQSAKEKALNYKVAKLPMKKVARAFETWETRGLMKVLVDADSGKILGAAVLGAEGGEIMTILQVAMMGDLAYTQLRDGIFAHPTYAEALNKLFKDVE